MSFRLSIDDELAEIIGLIHSDRATGLEQLRRLAAAGDRSAILSLGLYLSEDSATNDEAVPWLEQAAEFDSPDAAWNLAMIAREQGDPEGMRRWIDRAAALGEADAIKVQQAGYDVAEVLETYR